MSNVKKAFQPLYELLEANKSKKIATMLPEILELIAKSKNSGSDTGRNFVKDQDGNVIAVYCYYHKQWELVEHVPYGKKASNTSTGLNTMCKLGVSAWTKQQRIFARDKDALLNDFIADLITKEEMNEKLDVINAEVTKIVPLCEQDNDLAAYTAENIDDLITN